MKKPHVKVSGAYTHYDQILPMIIKHRKVLDFSVYDGIDHCRWNGGRVNREVFDDPKKRATYENLGVGISLAFSNPTIDLDDPVGNELLERFHRENNGIILQNEGLLELIRRKYPKYETIFSITGHPPVLDDPTAYYRDLESKYDIIVPKLEDNMIIERFTQNVDRYELLINDDCLYHCPLWKKHFDAISAQNTKGIKYIDDECGNWKIEECWLPKKVFDPYVGDTKARAEHGFRFGMSLNSDQIKERMSIGIHRYKVSGREMARGEFHYNITTLLEAINKAAQ